MAKPNVLEFEQEIAELDTKIEQLQLIARREGRLDVADEADKLEAKRNDFLKTFFRKLSAWDEVLLARHQNRPYTLDYVPQITEDFLELKGDRLFGDDGALVGGLATIAGMSVVLIGQQKGRDLKERQKRNFGYMRPEGYRKALRLMEMAAKFGCPVVCLIDTPGADPNVGSEERGISEAIARNLREMSVLPVPTIGIVIGEGGSGGALGIAVCDRVLMLEHAIYSVIAPEGCAAILWRDSKRGADAAEAMRVTAKDAYTLGLVDGVLTEPMGGAHRDPLATAQTIREAILCHLNELQSLPTDDLLTRRAQKLRNLGSFGE
jgi:acetyl-CoA carboxylase carboxyl transferase subunit alpha